MLTVSQYLAAIPDKHLRERTLNAVAAMILGFPILKWLEFLPQTGLTVTISFTGASTGGVTRPFNTAFTAGTPSLSQYSYLLRIAGGKFQIDRAMIDQDPVGALRAALLTQKLKDNGGRLFRMFFTGDKDDASDKEFHGLNELTADLSKQVVAGTDGAVVTADMMDSLLDMVPGANLIMANRTLARQIHNLDVGVTYMLPPGGEKPEMFEYQYKGRPILVVEQAPNDSTGALEDILPFNETQGASSACSRITAARFGTIEGLHGLQNAPPEMRAPRLEDEFETNFMQWIMTPVFSRVKNSAAQIIGVKAS